MGGKCSAHDFMANGAFRGQQDGSWAGTDTTCMDWEYQLPRQILPANHELALLLETPRNSSRVIVVGIGYLVICNRNCNPPTVIVHRNRYVVLGIVIGIVLPDRCDPSTLRLFATLQCSSTVHANVHAAPHNIILPITALCWTRPEQTRLDMAYCYALGKYYQCPSNSPSGRISG